MSSSRRGSLLGLTVALALALIGPLTPGHALASPGAAEEATAAERATIVQVVTDAYIDGVHNFRDPAAMRRGFHPDFEMLMLRDGKLVKVPLAKWIEGMEARNLKEPPPVASAEAPRATSAKFPSVEISGTAATCKVEVWRDGKQLFTDYLALYRFDDGWKIVSKTFFSHS